MLDENSFWRKKSKNNSRIRSTLRSWKIWINRWGMHLINGRNRSRQRRNGLLAVRVVDRRRGLLVWRARVLRNLALGIMQKLLLNGGDAGSRKWVRCFDRLRSLFRFLLRRRGGVSMKISMSTERGQRRKPKSRSYGWW